MVALPWLCSAYCCLSVHVLVHHGGQPARDGEGAADRQADGVGKAHPENDSMCLNAVCYLLYNRICLMTMNMI